MVSDAQAAPFPDPALRLGRAVSPDVHLTRGEEDVAPEAARWPFFRLSLARPAPRLHLLLDRRRQDWFGRAIPGEDAIGLHIRPEALDGWMPPSTRSGELQAGAFFASEAMAAIADDLLHGAPATPDGGLFLAARSLSLISLVLSSLQAGELTPAASEVLSEGEIGRLQAARRLIHERYSEDLTLDGVARSCGLSRSRLTQGFRQLFKSSVGEALAERRLQQAAQGLRASDAAVSTIGYRVGYTSNAAFTRAFTRRFGEAPTRYRTRGARSAPVAALAGADRVL